MSAEPPAFPRALDDDDDDVAWALQTAAVQWERGGVADAIVWLKRAAEAAAESGEFGRSADLQRRANDLDRWVNQRPSFPLQADDGDDGVDGVDDLLATDAPEIEAVGMGAPSPSLVDVLEAEERGELDTDPLPHGADAPVQDLGDLQDVEDIEAIDVDDFEQRQLGGYSGHPLDEITQARSSITQAPTSTRAERRPASNRVKAPLPSASPPSQRGPSSKPASSRPASSSSRSGSRAPRSAREAPAREYKLPPPPVPRLPLPLPKTASLTPTQADKPYDTFAPEPNTRRRSEPPEPPPPSELDDDPTATPIIVPARLRTESLPEVSATELEMPTLEPPPSAAASSPSVAAPPQSRAPSAARQREAWVTPPISSAGPAELEAAVQTLSETPPPVAVAPSLDVALVAACRGLEDLPPETQAQLAAKARVEVLGPEQEVSGFGLALVTRGSVVVMPTIAEGACGQASRGEPVFSRGTLSEGVALRVVAQAEGADVAVWRPEDFEQVLETCPWVADELRAVADRFQALAGAAMGPLGERLDDSMRAMLTDRCEVRVLMAGEVLIEEGTVPAGLFVVGGGKLELVVVGAVQAEFGPGDLPFASSTLTREKASGTVRAATSGALVLHADRMTAHELIVGLPPLLELLSTV